MDKPTTKGTQLTLKLFWCVEGSTVEKCIKYCPWGKKKTEIAVKFKKVLENYNEICGLLWLFN